MSGSYYCDHPVSVVIVVHTVVIYVFVDEHVTPVSL